MSVAGTLASIAGGALVGVLMGVTLVAENMRCRENWSGVVLSTVIWGASAGFLGSLVDSLMGAIIQQTRYSEEKKVILQDGADTKNTKVVSGMNLLTNNQVNLVSSIFTSVVVGVLSQSRG